MGDALRRCLSYSGILAALACANPPAEHALAWPGWSPSPCPIHHGLALCMGCDAPAKIDFVQAPKSLSAQYNRDRNTRSSLLFSTLPPLSSLSSVDHNRFTSHSTLLYAVIGIQTPFSELVSAGNKARSCLRTAMNHERSSARCLS
jgi:hypothetical protein